MDALGKETLVNAYYEKLKAQAARGDFSGLGVLDPADRAKAVENLKNDEVSNDIKYVLFSKLLDYQPVTKSQLPEFYNTTGNMRILYMLKSYTVKQIDIFRQEAFSKISDGVRTQNKAKVTEGMKNLILLATSLAALGVGTDIIKNFLLNRDFDLGTLAVDNVLKLMGFSKYTVYQAKNE
jgi:hypothetical protein